MENTKAKAKFYTVKKANEILINKIDELKNYLETQSFNMGEKEINKYYNLKTNEKAQVFKSEYEKKADLLQAKIGFSVEKLDSEKLASFIKDLINYYAKVEDGYFEVLNTSKNTTLNAISLFKCEVTLDYYKSNLAYINALEDKLVNKIEQINGKTLTCEECNLLN